MPFWNTPKNVKKCPEVGDSAEVERKDTPQKSILKLNSESPSQKWDAFYKTPLDPGCYPDSRILKIAVLIPG